MWAIVVVWSEAETVASRLPHFLVGEREHFLARGLRQPQTCALLLQADESKVVLGGEGVVASAIGEVSPVTELVGTNQGALELTRGALAVVAEPLRHVRGNELGCLEACDWA